VIFSVFRILSASLVLGCNPNPAASNAARERRFLNLIPGSAGHSGGRRMMYPAAEGRDARLARHVVQIRAQMHVAGPPHARALVAAAYGLI